MSDSGFHDVAEPSRPPLTDRLDTWKEIAGYLRKSLRTVQLWEEMEGLPVHRLSHKSLGSVFGFRSELDAWWMGRESRPPRPPKRIIIAVLPFEPLRGDSKVEALSAGLSDDIGVQLISVCDPDVGVLARRSTARFKDCQERLSQRAAELGVTHLLEGTFRRTGERPVVTLELIRLADQTNAWAQSYECNLVDDLISQRRLAREIAESISASLQGPRRVALSKGKSLSSGARQNYLKGRFFWNRRTAQDLWAGVQCFEAALQEQPDYSAAYAGLADCYVQLSFYGILPTAEAMKMAKAAAAKAIELDDSLGEAHASLADVMTYLDWDMTGAEKEYRRAIQLDPNYATAYHWYADSLAMMGRFDEALINSRRALELDPVSPIINLWYGMKYYLLSDYDEAINQYRRTIEMHPDYLLLHWALGLAYEQQGDYESAVLEKKKAVQLSSEKTWLTAGLGYSLALSGKRKKAQEILQRLVSRARDNAALFYEAATIHAALHDEDQAVYWLHKAYDHHAAWAPYMRVEPRLKVLGRNLEFQQLVGKFSVGKLRNVKSTSTELRRLAQ